MSDVTVIHNPASGGAIDDRRLREAFEPYERSHRLTWSPTTEDDPGPGQAAKAVANNAETVIVCGGDGTVRAVAEQVAGSSSTLGVVPLGTGNLLAENLTIPQGLDAVPVALSAPATTIDVGVVNDEVFLVMAGVGFDAAMIRDADPKVKRRLGSFAYVISALRNLPARIFSATLTVDEEQVWSGRAAMVLVGNCSSINGGIEVHPQASPSDGRLDVAVLTADRWRDWARVAWRLVRGREQPRRLVARYTGASIGIEFDEPQPYELDGEDRPPTDRLDITVRPGSLAVRRR